VDELVRALSAVGAQDRAHDEPRDECAERGQERAEQALRFVLEVARLLGAEVRARAQALLESLPEAEQARQLDAAAEAPAALDESVGRLIALLARG